MNDYDDNEEMGEFATRMSNIIGAFVEKTLNYASERYLKPFIWYSAFNRKFDIKGFKQNYKEFENSLEEDQGEDQC